MEECQQSKDQSIWEHGISVSDHMIQLIEILKGERKSDGWRIPQWMIDNSVLMLGRLPSLYQIEDYCLYHDCGKPFCVVYDDEGKAHFPGHAEKSAETWLRVYNDQLVAGLIRLDMKMHTMKCEDVGEFAANEYACTLVLSSFAEIHANAEMFGGIDSVNFKIKWKHLDRRGKAIISQIKVNVK